MAPQISDAAAAILENAGFDPLEVAAELGLERITTASARKYVDQHQAAPAAPAAEPEPEPEPLTEAEAEALATAAPTVRWIADPPAPVREAITLDIATKGLPPKVLAWRVVAGEGRFGVAYYVTPEGRERSTPLRAPIVTPAAPLAGLIGQAEVQP